MTTIASLKKAIIHDLLAGSVKEDDVDLAKYFPHEFSYHPITFEALELDAAVKQARKQKPGAPAPPKPPVEENLRKTPFLLKDGGKDTCFRLNAC
jgi:hypothetical protein